MNTPRVNRYVIGFFMIASLVVCLLLSSCNRTSEDRSSDKNNRTSEVRSGDNSHGWQGEYQKFKEENETAIANNEKRIEELRMESLREVNTASRDNYIKQVAAFERRNNELRVRVRTYDQGEREWGSFRSNVERDSNTLQSDLKRGFVLIGANSSTSPQTDQLQRASAS